MSVSFTAADLASWTAGSLVTGDAGAATVFHGVSINTRTLSPGELFVAIRGDVHDAHRFVAQAIQSGAAGLLVERGWLAAQDEPMDVVTVAVDDTTTALGALAAGHRGRFSGPVVAITGSNGKTTTKEMTHQILSVPGPCLKNQGNLNNEFGLPLTLLAREPRHWAAVVELGMNHRGEIARLAAIARPDVAVITNVGTAHLEFLGSRDEIAREKGDILSGLSPSGVAVLNRDDARVWAQRGRAPGAVSSFGLAPGADVSAEHVDFDAEGCHRFELVTPAGRRPVRVRGLAETTVINALAAAAAALAAGVDLDDVATGLGRHADVAGRMAIAAGPVGTHVIDDTYNANPQSMRNGLESLARLKAEGRAIAVLGGMGELGEAADEAHRQTGRLAAELGTDHLVTVGERAAGIANGAREAGLPADRVHHCKEHEEAASQVLALLRAGDWVLVKGSRAMQMERIVESLAKATEGTL